MTKKTSPLLLAALAMTASSAIAQSAGPNKFNVSGRFGFNLSADFKDIGGFPAQTNPGPAAGNTDHFYDDGYNRVDNRGVNDGLTWFWGYSNDSQTPGDGTVVMNSSSSPSGRSVSAEDDPQLGFEISYGRELGRLGRANWGLETALGYTRLDFDNNRSLRGREMRVTDVYSLMGGVPPAGGAPVSGDADGPGQLISDTPTRTTAGIPGGAIITGKRELEASLFGFKLGPYLEIPIARHFAVSLHGGLAVAHVDSRFKFSETVTIPGMGPALQPGVSNTQTSAGSGSDSDWLVGGYAGAQLNFPVTDRWSIFTGAEYQNVGKFSQTVSGKRAEIDLGQSIFVTGGVSFRF